MSLATKLNEVKNRVEVAAKRAGRSNDQITLIGVSKTVDRSTIVEAYELGLHNFGENRIPDAEAKFFPLPYPSEAASLHLIGHLQTNKVKRAINLAQIIHSVDSLRLAQAISRAAQESGKTIPILLEVNVAGEASKHGLTPNELSQVLADVLELANLEIRGLMTIAPYFEQAEQTRFVFAALRELFQHNNPGLTTWRDLSMGMTNDFEVAIEEGATMVRIGRAIFG